MNRLQLFILLRMIEISFLIYLKVIDALTESKFKTILGAFIIVTAVVLVANFSRYKKYESHKLPITGWFLLVTLFITGFELFTLYGTPKGYFSFATTQWIIGICEIGFAVCLGFIRKFDLI